MGSGNIAQDFLGRKIELLRLAQELFEVLHDGRVIEAVDDALVRIHDEVDVAARHGLALQVEPMDVKMTVPWKGLRSVRNVGSMPK